MTTTGIWRTHKYDITTGALVTAFDGDGIATNTLAATGDERPQAIKVDSDYLYIAGYDNVAGNIEWRIEKRNKTTGALCASVLNVLPEPSAWVVLPLQILLQTLMLFMQWQLMPRTYISRGHDMVQ
jgi:hypothetical protein